MSLDIPAGELPFPIVPAGVGDDELAVSETQYVSAAVRLAQLASAAIVLLEVTPVNEALRGMAVTSAEMATHNPSVTTAAFAGTTFAVEAGAAAVTARLLASPGADEVVGWIHKKASKFGVGSDGYRTGVVADVMLGSFAGSAVTVFAKQVQNPGRTVAQNVRLGVANSAAVATLWTPAVYGVTKFAETVGWENVGIGTGLAALAIGTKTWVSNRLNRVADLVQDAPEPSVQAFEAAEPDYRVDQRTIDRTEAELVAMVRQDVGRKACAVWVSGDTVAANVIRTLEAQLFPEIPEIMKDNEDSSGFMAVVDARPSAGDGRIIRATRLSGSEFVKARDRRDPIKDLAFLHGLVDSGQITEEEITTYYETHRFDLDDTVSVETNFRVGERAERIRGVPMSFLAYSAMFKRAVRTTRRGALTTVVAHINAATKKSLNHMGIIYEPFAGRDDLRTPDETGGYDDKYEPVVYVNEGRTRRVFSWLVRYASLPEIEV